MAHKSEIVTPPPSPWLKSGGGHELSPFLLSTVEREGRLMIKGRDSGDHEGFLPRPRSERGWKAEIDMSPAAVCSRAFVEDPLTCVHTWLRFHYVLRARMRTRGRGTAVLKFLRANVPEGAEKETELEYALHARFYVPCGMLLSSARPFPAPLA